MTVKGSDQHTVHLKGKQKDEAEFIESAIKMHQNCIKQISSDFRDPERVHEMIAHDQATINTLLAHIQRYRDAIDPDVAASSLAHHQSEIQRLRGRLAAVIKAKPLAAAKAMIEAMVALRVAILAEQATENAPIEEEEELSDEERELSDEAEAVERLWELAELEEHRDDEAVASTDFE